MGLFEAIVFDKDGTLFDFRASWSGWAETVLSDLAGGREDLMRQGGDAIGYDLAKRDFRRDSIAIGGTTEDVALKLASLLGRDHGEIVAHLNGVAAAIEQTPVPNAVRTLAELSANMTIGLVTNDSERNAREHLKSAGVARYFSFVAGYDSGFGAKPGPGQLHGFAKAMGADLKRSAMVGDSPHDLLAGRAAGMTTVGVLTGVANAGELSDLADAVLPDISHLPRWIAGRVRGG